jgi:cobalt/nickel transport system ATP-binding protein
VLAANESGKTIITATHDLHIVGEIADTVHVFGQEKKIIRSGAHSQILADEELLRANNLIHIHRHRHKNEVHTHPHTHLEHHALGEQY